MAKPCGSIVWKLLTFIFSAYSIYQTNTYGEMLTHSAHPGNMVTTTLDNVDNKVTTTPDDVDNRMTTPLDGVDNKMTTTSGSVDNKVTTTPDGVNNKMTTTSGSVDNKVTTTLDSVVNNVTSSSSGEDRKIASSPDMFTSGSHRPPGYVFGPAVSITGVDRLILGESGLTVSCSASSQDIVEVEHVHLYRTVNDSMYLESIVSISKPTNESVLRWTDETLRGRPGVSAKGRIDTVDSANLTFSIEPNYTRCGDAVEYKCIMAMRTTSGKTVAISNSKHVSLYPPVEPTFTDDIIVLSPPAHVNSNGHYQYDELTIVHFSCTGIVGSDKRPHEWRYQTASDWDSCGMALERLISENIDQNEDGVRREDCNFWRTSVAPIQMKVTGDVDAVYPATVWCRPYVPQTSTGQCDQLTENNLVKKIVIDVYKPPYYNITHNVKPPDLHLARYPYILASGRNYTYEYKEAITLRCRWGLRTNGELTRPIWYHKKKYLVIFGNYSVFTTEESDMERIYTLTIFQSSFASKGLYFCLDRNQNLEDAYPNQTVFVDITYEKCRETGVVTPGGECIAVVSADNCLSNNGTPVTIHTAKKAQFIFEFVGASHVTAALGLTLTSKRMRWKDFVWADGSSLTFRENMTDVDCISCKDDSHFPMTIGMDNNGGTLYIDWRDANSDTDVICEWTVKVNVTGLAIPPSNASYVGAKSLFRCTWSGEFISTEFVCDRIFDCNDKSDELSCAPECTEPTFQCEYGGCISASSVCDFYPDCFDGSDELLCNHPACEEDYWRCDNSECIPVYDVCDGDEECADGSDEADILCIDSTSEPTQYTFLCSNPNRIFPLSRFCDGDQDCFNPIDGLYCLPKYHSCGAWAVSTSGRNASVGVDYGMTQYGSTNALCIADTTVVYTIWPFSANQVFRDKYKLAKDLVSQALWIGIESDVDFQHISYPGHKQQKEALTSSSSCVQYIRPCGYFSHQDDYSLEWTNDKGHIFSLNASTYGCFGYCASSCNVWFDYPVLPTPQTYYDEDKDLGWLPITNQDQLPITMMRSRYTSVVGVSRLKCWQEKGTIDVKYTAVHLQCKNGHYYNPAMQCLMNFEPAGEPMACRDLSHLQNCENFACPEDYVKCPGSFCLHTRYICDGRSHCPHQEDELDCETHACIDHYRCRANKQCVPQTYLCDGIRHCPRGDDERLCDVTCPRGCTCHGLTYLCESREESPRLGSIPSDARWISIKSNLSEIAHHVPLRFPMLTTLMLQTCFLHQLTIDKQGIFKNMTALQHLDLSWNLLTTIPDNVFIDLPRLKYLILSHNPIVYISGQAFHGFKALRNLQLSHTGIKQLHAGYSGSSSILKGLTAMEELDLSSNAIQTLPGNLFFDLQFLKTLSLNNNPLEKTDASAFSGLYTLTSLQLSYTNPSRLENGLFNDLRSLKTLNLSSTNTKELAYGIFENLQKLETLDIQNNHIQVEELMFGGLDSLRYLYADSYKVCCIKPESVLDTNCFAPTDIIYTCANLIGNDVLRICLWLIGVSAVVGNTLVIIYRVVLDTDNLKKSHSIFVINLGVSDLLMGVYMIIIASVDTHYSGRYALNDQTWRYSSLCIAAGSLSVISSEMSTFAILMITIDRFIAIVFPLSLEKITWRSALVVSSLLWIVALALAIVPQVFFGGYFKGEFYSRSGVCLALPLTREHTPGEEYAVAVFIGLNGLLFMVIMVAQLAIHRKCKDSASIATSQNRKREIAVAKSLFLVVTTDFCCWFPVGLLGVWSQLGGTLSADVYAWVMVFVLPVNSAINPLLYTYTYLKRQREIAVAKKMPKALPNAEKGKMATSKELNPTRIVLEIYFSKLYKTRSGSVTLAWHSRSAKLSPPQAYLVARRTIEAVSFLHTRGILHGNVSTESIYFNIGDKVMKHVTLSLEDRPISGDKDAQTDILQYGLLVKKLLRMLDRH